MTIIEAYVTLYRHRNEAAIAECHGICPPIVDSLWLKAGLLPGGTLLDTWPVWLTANLSVGGQLGLCESYQDLIIAGRYLLLEGGAAYTKKQLDAESQRILDSLMDNEGQLKGLV